MPRLPAGVLDLRPRLANGRMQLLHRAIEAARDGDFSKLPPGARVSGGPIEGFTQGWAKAGWDARAVHWYELKPSGLVAICGFQVKSTPGIFGPGNFERCDRCVLKRSKLIKRGFA